jgi:prepilin-type N-terminal cleavage/methylation domain-containing protein
MQPTAYLNKKGVTLVEVMISLVILLFVFMGLIQASLVSINSNLRNEIRDAAVSVASEYMSRAKATSFDTLLGTLAVCNAAMTSWTIMTTPNPPPYTIRQVRNVTQQFTVGGCQQNATLNNMTVTINVTYNVPGDATNYSQTVSSIVKRP